MILLLDVGNTRVKWAWLDYLELAPVGAAAHDASHRSWQREIEAAGNVPRRIVVASVAGPSFAAALTLWSRDRYRVEPEFVHSSASLCGVTNAYTRPTALGVDRWLGLIAAWRRESLPAIIVNCGTAVTVDIIDPSGNHGGGLIVPGTTMMRDARGPLLNSAEKAQPAIDPSGFPLIPAPSDPALHTIGALIDRVWDETRASCGTTLRLLLTGGDAHQVLPYLLNQEVEQVPDLVLTGLAIVATRGQDGAQN